MKTIDKHNIYFLGAGGIGMSALARHFKNMGKNVAGYDRTPTPLTNALIDEGVKIHFDDSIDKIPQEYKNKNNTLVIYTPAIPDGHNEFNFFKDNGFELVKRAFTLGMITNEKKGIAVAGTHGKTSTSTLAAYILQNSKVDCSAFLGGISKNFHSNYLFSKNSDYVVVEADEFDRSFLHLHPNIAIVTAIDPDHLDIYSNKENILNSFNEFISQVDEDGYLILNKKTISDLRIPVGPTCYSYALKDNSCDFYASHIQLVNGLFNFTLNTPWAAIKDLTLGIPGNVNLENAVASMAASLIAGVSAAEIKSSLPNLKGVKRRIDILYRSENSIYIDDYAHHPEEIKRLLESLIEIFPDKTITGIFQPHLFSRTKDFAEDFAKSLSLLDKLYLLDIYPARELPIPGVTSQIIYNDVTCQQKKLCKLDNIMSLLKNSSDEILVTIGAGDIDTLTNPIVQLLKERDHEKV